MISNSVDKALFLSQRRFISIASRQVPLVDYRPILLSQQNVKNKKLPYSRYQYSTQAKNNDNLTNENQLKAIADKPTNVVVPTSKAKKKEPLIKRIKHEFRHYVNGTKLLGYEIKVSTKHLIKFVQGYELSRRETNQLKRTMGDIFRLVPFSAFLIIPFAELLLPVALKLFPNLLPSTYESGFQRQLKRTKLIEIRNKTSAFLHETLDESSFISYNSIENLEKRKAFFDFFKKIYENKSNKRTMFTHEEIATVAKMFKSDIVLDNLSRPQLTAMSKFMSLRPFGADNMLRYQIRSKLKSMMNDDKVVDYEGINSLSHDELYQACVSRGMKAYGVPENDLKDNLKVWLQLRLRDKIPSVLMVLSSAFTFGALPKEDKKHDNKSYSPVAAKKEQSSNYDNLLDLYYDGILHVLSTIPDPVYNIAKLDVTESKTAKEEKLGDKEGQEQPTESQKLAETVKEATEMATGTAKDTANIISESKKVKKEVAREQHEEEKEEKKMEDKEGEKEDKDKEAERTTDDSAFKLNVLKEQEELIKKEEEEAKTRKTSNKEVSDDLTLDEDDTKATPPIPADQAPERSITKK
ncbi:hypothetical protein KAFR_0D01390 [Kazachstania africana CBS 2517]|uniref:Letm1 RBD domain-containing protein n=1 Tax=Kazachstania africana (strain ATCC 22294 / BCRC 22015 / CBS 2517 / CECT 1963 / NBRC 1671 / NRRL Y-8276) TaxID=1071382 RepID=H2ATT5_KAZAF|nr:hypothetical protein KAFR_0D01390 [Kazachstania africana CBS 2517]CCF57785.1 hypothetical protein KAFR_0D01390 [Kazachstania africana CBS 2517]